MSHINNYTKEWNPPSISMYENLYQTRGLNPKLYSPYQKRMEIEIQIEKKKNLFLHGQAT